MKGKNTGVGWGRGAEGGAGEGRETEHYHLGRASGVREKKKKEWGRKK